MMNLETKWKWFKRSTRLVALASGVFIAKSIIQQDLTLLVASLGLGLGGVLVSIMIGFVDAFLEDIK